MSSHSTTAARYEDLLIFVMTAVSHVGRYWRFYLVAFVFLLVSAGIAISLSAQNQPPSPLQGGQDQGQAAGLISQTQTPEQTSQPQQTLKPPQVQQPYVGIWISAQELAALPTSGPAWDALKAAADRNPGKPNIKDQNENNDVYVLAEALVYARTGNTVYRDKTIENLMAVMGTEKGGRTLALARNLVSYVIAADLINLPADPARDSLFRGWLLKVVDENLGGMTLRSTQANRPNNWGAHAGASMAAVDRYLGNVQDLSRVAAIFHGYLGDRVVYQNFQYGADLSWQCDPANPVGVDPPGCTINGHNVNGALPEEMRRGGHFQWPPAKTGYAWEALQGAGVEAQILSRAGYPAWEWQDQALLRAVNFLYSIGWAPQGDDEWQVWLINHAYGTHFQAALPAHFGKNMGWTDWTFPANPPKN